MSRAGFSDRRRKGEVLNSIATQLQVNRWLTENGPKELELLFRAIVFQPSTPILLADNDRLYREASVGASKLLGLPREKIIGRKTGTVRIAKSGMWRLCATPREPEDMDGQICDVTKRRNHVFP